MIGCRSRLVFDTSLRWSDRTFPQSGSDTTAPSQLSEPQLVIHTLTCIVKAVLPTPPSPSTTNLYKVIFPAILKSARDAISCRVVVTCLVSKRKNLVGERSTDERAYSRHERSREPGIMTRQISHVMCNAVRHFKFRRRDFWACASF